MTGRDYLQAIVDGQAAAATVRGACRSPDLVSIEDGDGGVPLHARRIDLQPGSAWCTAACCARCSTRPPAAPSTPQLPAGVGHLLDRDQGQLPAVRSDGAALEIERPSTPGGPPGRVRRGTRSRRGASSSGTPPRRSAVFFFLALVDRAAQAVVLAFSIALSQAVALLASVGRATRTRALRAR